MAGKAEGPHGPGAAGMDKELPFLT
jgi:hypothetical protein